MKEKVLLETAWRRFGPVTVKVTVCLNRRGEITAVVFVKPDEGARTVGSMLKGEGVLIAGASMPKDLAAAVPALLHPRGGEKKGLRADNARRTRCTPARRPVQKARRLGGAGPIPVEGRA